MPSRQLKKRGGKKGVTCRRASPLLAKLILTLHERGANVKGKIARLLRGNVQEHLYDYKVENAQNRAFGEADSRTVVPRAFIKEGRRA